MLVASKKLIDSRDKMILDVARSIILGQVQKLTENSREKRTSFHFGFYKDLLNPSGSGDLLSRYHHGKLRATRDGSLT